MILFKSILNEKTASLLLYGEISDEGGDGKIASRDIVNELMYMDCLLYTSDAADE